MGKSEQQTSVQVEDDFFFMRQDRPKFSAQERYVPSTQSARAFHFGMLGIRLAGGTAAEAIKQNLGLKGSDSNSSGLRGYAINKKNAERLT